MESEDHYSTIPDDLLDPDPDQTFVKSTGGNAPASLCHPEYLDVLPSIDDYREPYERSYAKPYEDLCSPVKFLARRAQAKRLVRHLPVPPPITPPPSPATIQAPSVTEACKSPTEGHRGTVPYRLHPIQGPSTSSASAAQQNQHDNSYTASRYEEQFVKKRIIFMSSLFGTVFKQFNSKHTIHPF